MRGSRSEQPQLYQRGRIWWCYWRGERWSTRTADRREAAKAVREHYDPRVSASRQATIEDAIRLLYDALDRRGRSEATRTQAREKLGHFARLWEGTPLADITHTTLMAYIDERIKVDKVKRLTVSHELGYLRQAWKLARAQGWSPRAWDEVMPERFDRGYRPRTRWLTAEELGRVLAELDDDQAAWVAWVVATGSDVSDVPRAQAGDVDYKRGLVRVRGTKTRFRDRLVPITKLTRPLLKFACEHGPPFIAWPWVNIVLRKLARRLGLEHFTPKDLRRTHAMWLRNAGVEPHLIGRVLGHADSRMADEVYGQGDEDAIARLVRQRTNSVRTARKARTPRASRTRKAG